MTVTTTYTLQSVRSEFTANNVATGDQFLSNVTGLANGGYALTYGSGAAPQLTVYNTATGAANALFNPAGDANVDMQGEPVITQLKNGNIIVVWKEGAGGDNDMLATIYNPATGLLVGTKDIALGGIAANTDPEITALSNGNWVVTYVNASGGISFQIRDATGAQVDITRTIFSAGTSDPSITATADGGFAIVAVFNSNIFSTMRDANGNLIGSQFAVSGNTSSSPQVAALKGGGFAMVYDGVSGGEPAIFLKLSSAAQDVVIRVDFPENKEDSDPEITVLANGFIAVTWAHQFSATDKDIFARVFDPSGNPIVVDGNDLIVINNLSNVNESQPSIAALLNGMFVTTWTDTETDGSGDRISARVDELVRVKTSDGFDFFFSGDDALREILNGGGDGDIMSASGNDTVNGDAGDDTIIVRSSVGDNAQVLNGGADIDKFELLVETSSFEFDLRNDTLTSFEEFSVKNNIGGTVAASVLLNANQFGTGLAGNIAFETEGPVSVVDINITMAGETSFDLSSATSQFGFGIGRFLITGDGDSETITGPNFATTMRGNGGDDLLIGGNGGNTMDGGSGDDSLFGGTLADNLIGGTENDFLSGGSGNVADTLNGGAGIDTAFWSDDATGNIIATLSETGSGNVGGNVAGIGNDTFTGIENMFAGAGNDKLTGNSQANELRGYGGNDTLKGLGGNDLLEGRTGNDTMDGGAGSDTINLNGATGSIVLTLAAGGARQTLSAVAGIDQDTIINIENILAGIGKDVLMGNGLRNHFQGSLGDDTLGGGDGRDILDGGDGRDILDGGAGNDSLRGNSGGDTLDGGTGSDTASYRSDGAVRVSLDKSVVATGAAGGDTFISIENLSGSNAGSDLLAGNAGKNILRGYVGNDSLYGRSGNDTLVGGMGADKLNGGSGKDVFDYNSIRESSLAKAGRDRINSFNEKATDKIDLSTIDAIAGTVKNDAFKFIENHAFTKLGQVRAYFSGTDTFIDVNTTGSTAADMRIVLTGHHTLDGLDFSL